MFKIKTDLGEFKGTLNLKKGLSKIKLSETSNLVGWWYLIKLHIPRWKKMRRIYRCHGNGSHIGLFYVNLRAGFFGNQLTNFNGFFPFCLIFYYLKDSGAILCNFCFVLPVGPTKCGEMPHFREKALKWAVFGLNDIFSKKMALRLSRPMQEYCTRQIWTYLNVALTRKAALNILTRVKSQNTETAILSLETLNMQIMPNYANQITKNTHINLTSSY